MFSAAVGGFIYYQSAGPSPGPAVATAGWYGAGYYLTPAAVLYSTVGRITFATDTATATVRGPLSVERYALGATGTLTYGWFGGGYVLSPAAAAISTVDRITYTTDTATASVRGPLTAGKYSVSGTSDGTTYGWMAGGYVPGTGRISTVDRITYATDTATATQRGSLATILNGQGSTGDSNYGWYMGGYSTAVETNVQRITYATDTATASVRGPLVNFHFRSSATTDTIYGWVAGNSGNGYSSNVDRIIFATDTATASVRGPLSSTSYFGASSGDNTYGWFAISSVGSTFTTTITRITYATDTAVSTNRGNMALSTRAIAGTSGSQ